MGSDADRLKENVLGTCRHFGMDPKHGYPAYPKHRKVAKMVRT